MTLEEYTNQQHEIDLELFHGIFKTQNAHGERNVLPRCEVSRWEFSTKSDIAVLIRTGTAPVAIHGNIRMP